MSWVGAAIAKIAKGDTFSAAWKNLISTPDTHEEVLASAQAAHAAGALFKNVKGRQPPEFAPEPEEAEVDDFDAGDDESQADDQGLLYPEEAPMAAGETDTLAADDARAADALEAGGAQSRHPQNKTNPGQRQMQRRASEEANIGKLGRLMALRLIYGRHPPKPAASAPSA